MEVVGTRKEPFSRSGGALSVLLGYIFKNLNVRSLKKSTNKDKVFCIWMPSGIILDINARWNDDLALHWSEYYKWIKTTIHCKIL